MPTKDDNPTHPDPAQAGFLKISAEFWLGLACAGFRLGYD